MQDRNIPFRIGSDKLPGLSKLVEEAGEVNQIIGKIMGLGSMGQHWDGQILQHELEKELADLSAAIKFVADKNNLSMIRIVNRGMDKEARFHQWHDNIQAGRDPNHGVIYAKDEHAPTQI